MPQQLRTLKHGFKQKIKNFDKRQINYKFLKRQKLKKTKQQKSRPINRILSSLFAETTIKNT